MPRLEHLDQFGYSFSDLRSIAWLTSLQLEESRKHHGQHFVRFTELVNELYRSSLRPGELNWDTLTLDPNNSFDRYATEFGPHGQAVIDLLRKKVEKYHSQCSAVQYWQKAHAEDPARILAELGISEVVEPHSVQYLFKRNTVALYFSDRQQIKNLFTFIYQQEGIATTHAHVVQSFFSSTFSLKDPEGNTCAVLILGQKKDWNHEQKHELYYDFHENYSYHKQEETPPYLAQSIDQFWLRTLQDKASQEQLCCHDALAVQSFLKKNLHPFLESQKEILRQEVDCRTTGHDYNNSLDVAYQAQADVSLLEESECSYQASLVGYYQAMMQFIAWSNLSPTEQLQVQYHIEKELIQYQKQTQLMADWFQELWDDTQHSGQKTQFSAQLLSLPIERPWALAPFLDRDPHQMKTAFKQRSSDSQAEDQVVFMQMLKGQMKKDQLDIDKELDDFQYQQMADIAELWEYHWSILYSFFLNFTKAKYASQVSTLQPLYNAIFPIVLDDVLSFKKHIFEYINQFYLRFQAAIPGTKVTTIEIQEITELYTRQLLLSILSNSLFYVMDMHYHEIETVGSPNFLSMIIHWCIGNPADPTSLFSGHLFTNDLKALYQQKNQQFWSQLGV